MKRVIIGVLVVVVLLVAGLLVAPGFIDWSKYKDQGLAQVKAKTGYDVTIDGSFAMAFLPFPHVYAEKVSVVNPAVSKDPLAKFDELSVSVALAPLLKGQVQVSEITMIKPDFDLRVNKDGKGNWLSPEVEALVANKQPAENTGDSATSNGGAKKQVEVSFDQITIEDGHFRFADAGKGSVTELKDIDLSVKAESLQGPFDVEGNLIFNEQETSFAVKTEAIDQAASSVTLVLQSKQGPYKADYKGVVAFAQPYEAQGEVALAASSVPGVDGSIALKGFVNASESAVSLKNTALQVGDKAFTGETQISLKPLKVQAAFKSNEILDLDALMAKTGKKTASGGASQDAGVAGVLDILPKTITLPQALDVDITVSGAGLVYNKELIKGVSLKARKQGREFSGEVQVSDIPGKGPAVIKGDLKFADVSTSSSGAQVFSDPVLNISIQANTQNTGYLVQALSGKSDIPVLSNAKIGKFYIQAEAAPGRIAVKDSVVNLDDLKLQLSGALKRGSGSRAQLSADVQANTLDLDALMKAQAGGAAKSGSAGGAQQDPLQALSLPFDLDASVAANTLVYNSQRFENVKASAAITDTQKNIKIQTFGADISVSGQSLDNLLIGVKHPNLLQASRTFGVALPAYQSFSNPVDLSFGLRMGEGGSIDLQNIKGRIAGSDVAGALGYDGSGAKPYISGDLKLGSLTLKSNKGSGGPASGSSSSGAGKWSSDVIDTAFLHAVNADFNISAQSLQYETWEMNSPSIKLSLKDGTLNVQDLQAGMFDGQIGLKAQLASSAANAPLSLSTQADIQNINLASLAYALSGTRQIQADGTVSFNANVSGSGASQKAIVSFLAGDAALSGTDVVMKGFNLTAITNAVERDNRENILAAVQSLGSGSTAFDTVSGTYVVNNGIVNIQSMAMNGPSASIVSTGSASLPAWTMDTTHTVSFNQTDKLDPFTFAIRGPIDKPLNTFGNIGKDILQAQAGKFIQKQIQDRLGDTDIGQKLQQFGVLPDAATGTQRQQAPAANDTTEPAAGVETQPQHQQQVDPAQQAIEGVLKGLLR